MKASEIKTIEIALSDLIQSAGIEKNFPTRMLESMGTTNIKALVVNGVFCLTGKFGQNGHAVYSIE